MSNEDLQKLRETGAKVVVEFLEPTVLVYWNSTTKTYEDSFSAKDVTLIEKLIDWKEDEGLNASHNKYD